MAEEDIRNEELKSIGHTPELDKTKRIKEIVLVVEDNTLALYAIKNILNKLNYEVTTVTDGKAALSTLQNQRFDWVLLDIGLPDIVLVFLLIYFDARDQLLIDLSAKP